MTTFKFSSPIWVMGVVEAVHSERYDNFNVVIHRAVGAVVEAVHSERYDNIG